MATTPKTKTGAAATRRAPARKAPTKAVATKITAKKPLARKSALRVTRPAIATKAVSTATRKPAPTKAPNRAAPKKVKFVRDSFSFPVHEHALLADMKRRALKLGKEIKKSEILRAGIVHLASLADSALVTVLGKVERVKKKKKK